jgi:hypothetical protein
MSVKLLGVLSIIFASGLAMSACAAETGPETSNESEAISGPSAGLTGEQAVARAMQWSDAKLHYCWAPNGKADPNPACSSVCRRTKNVKWDPYRSDCSGLVSWAWGLPAPGRTTLLFAPYKSDVTSVIQASKLRPGDAVNNKTHVMLFKSWETPGKRARFIEEPGCSSKTPYAHEVSSNVTIKGTSITLAYNGHTFDAIRFNSIKPSSTTSDGGTTRPDASTHDAATKDAGSVTPDAASNADASTMPDAETTPETTPTEPETPDGETESDEVPGFGPGDEEATGEPEPPPASASPDELDTTAPAASACSQAPSRSGASPVTVAALLAIGVVLAARRRRRIVSAPS